jgi:hypothetical protein
MDEQQRRDRIVNYLRIKPVNHGQIYTFQIAIPTSEVTDIPFDRGEYLKASLIQQETNLIPLIVRRTEAYSEEEEYELVYGADWYLVAKELDIEKLWVWVFDLTDEEAATAKEEMQQLLEIRSSQPSQVIEPELIQPIIQQLNKLFQQVAALNTKIDSVSASVKQLQASENQQKLGDDVIRQIITIIKQVVEETTTKIPELSSKPTSTIDNKEQDYTTMTVAQLKSIASKRKIKGYRTMKKQELITALTKLDQK